MSLTNPEEFLAWRDSPLTQEFLGLLRKRQLSMMEAWGSGTAWTETQQGQAVLLGELARLRFSEADQDVGPRGATIEDLAGLDLSPPVEEEDDG